MPKIRIEYFRDEGASWVFRVPSLGITGGGPDREIARSRALDAIGYTLEVTPDERPADAAEYLDVRVG